MRVYGWFGGPVREIYPQLLYFVLMESGVEEDVSNAIFARNFHYTDLLHIISTYCRSMQSLCKSTAGINQGRGSETSAIMVLLAR